MRYIFAFKSLEAFDTTTFTKKYNVRFDCTFLLYLLILLNHISVVDLNVDFVYCMHTIRLSQTQHMHRNVPCMDIIHLCLLTNVTAPTFKSIKCHFLCVTVYTRLKNIHTNQVFVCYSAGKMLLVMQAHTEN